MSFTVDLDAELTHGEVTDVLRDHVARDSSVFVVDPDSVGYDRASSGMLKHAP